MTAEDALTFDPLIRSVARKAVRKGYVDEYADAYQSAFLYCLTAKLDMMRSRNEISAYLRKRLTGSLIEIARKRFRKKRNEKVASLDQWMEINGEPQHCSSRLSNERERERIKNMREIMEIVFKLYSKRDVNIFTMYYYNCLNMDEIGKVVGLSRGRVCQIITEMRTTIRNVALKVSE